MSTQASQPGVPAGFQTVTPHLTLPDASAAIEFYQRALGAREVFRTQMPGGPVLHARLQIGDSFVMLNDEFPDAGAFGPKEGHSPVTVHLYVSDADALWERATKAGATVLMPLMDAFWGDRYGLLADPWGHRWSIASCLEELSPEQMAERAAQAFAAGS